MAKRRRLIVANWKMQGRLTSGLVLVQDILQMANADRPLEFDVVLCPPATLTWAVSEALMGTPISLGGQDCHTATHGAYTGDISAAMFTDLGCRYMIVGHSERRLGHGESNELIAQKVEAAQMAGLNVILCVGETAEQLSAGETTEVIQTQLREGLPKNIKLAHLIIAYEPVWAIGTGQQPSAEEVSAVHQTIRRQFGEVGETMRVLYGGSVSPANSLVLAEKEEIDGFLVGGASLNADGFWAIARNCI